MERLKGVSYEEGKLRKLGTVDSRTEKREEDTSNVRVHNFKSVQRNRFVKHERGRWYEFKWLNETGGGERKLCYGVCEM